MACTVVKSGIALTSSEFVAHTPRRLVSYKIRRSVDLPDTELLKCGFCKVLKRYQRDDFRGSSSAPRAAQHHGPRPDTEHLRDIVLVKSVIGFTLSVEILTN